MEITEANLEAEVLVRSSQVPVVVLLWSPRSEASVQLGDVLASLAATDGGKWSLATVNVDTVPRVAQMFGVQAIPTVVALAAGQPLSSFQGMQPPEQLRGWIDSLLNATAGKLGGARDAEDPEQVDPELAQARAHLDAGDFDAARSAYQAILDANPNHAEAKGAVRQIGFLQRATAHRPDAVAAADAAPDDIDAAFAAADVEILQQNIAAAFDRLIALVKRTADDDRTNGADPADRAVRSLRPGRSRGDRRPAQSGQRALLTRSAQCVPIGIRDLLHRAVRRARTTAPPAGAAP